MDALARESRLQVLTSQFVRPSKRTAVWGTLAALVVVLITLTYSWIDFGETGPTLVSYTVTPSDLPIVVTERGYLESQEKTVIECKAATYDRNSGSSSVVILSIVPNGSVVKKGDLLVEFDESSIRDRLESETLEYQSDNSTLMQAEARKVNQITQNETSVAEAQLELELALLDRKMYVDELSGSFKLSVEEIERQIDDTRNTILEVQAALKLQETEKGGIEELFRLGYKGKSDLEQSRFAFMKAEAALAAAVNRLSNHEATRRQLQTYEFKKELLRLDGAVATAERKLKQVKVTNESELAQVDAQLYEARQRVQRQKSYIDQLENQLENCKIYAPNAGMVVYAQDDDGRGEVIAEGVSVRQRQELLTLPDLSKMQVRTQIHEASLDQVRPGLPVTIRVDAFPNKTYQGVVSEVAVVPSQNSSTNAKTYDCVVEIPTEVQQLKPGMTAVSEIHVQRLEDVLSVPVQAIVQVDNETWCYVETESGVKKQAVELGRNNDKFVHLLSGIEAGARVVLNPMAIYKQEARQDKQISPDGGIDEAPEISPQSEAETVAMVAAAANADPESPSRSAPSADRSSRRSRGRSSGQADVQ